MAKKSSTKPHVKARKQAEEPEAEFLTPEEFAPIMAQYREDLRAFRESQDLTLQREMEIYPIAHQRAMTDAKRIVEIVGMANGSLDDETANGTPAREIYGAYKALLDACREGAGTAKLTPKQKAAIEDTSDFVRAGAGARWTQGSATASWDIFKNRLISKDFHPVDHVRRAVLSMCHPSEGAKTLLRYPDVSDAARAVTKSEYAFTPEFPYGVHPSIYTSINRIVKDSQYDDIQFADQVGDVQSSEFLATLDARAERRAERRVAFLESRKKAKQERKAKPRHYEYEEDLFDFDFSPNVGDEQDKADCNVEFQNTVEELYGDAVVRTFEIDTPHNPNKYVFELFVISRELNEDGSPNVLWSRKFYKNLSRFVFCDAADLMRTEPGARYSEEELQSPGTWLFR